MNRLAEALNNLEFITYFVRKGGGFNPLEHEHLTHRYLMTDEEYLNADLRYSHDAKGNAGKPQTREDKLIQLKIRNIQINKILQAYNQFLLGKKLRY